MFKAKKDDAKNAEVVAFLDKGIEFRGVLSFAGTIRVDGRVEGEIVSAGTLILGDEASVNGTINVGALVSQGRIEGEVIAKNKINLLSGSTLLGNIKTPILIVEEGAFFEGQSIMLKEEKTGYANIPIENQVMTDISVDVPKENPVENEEVRVKEGTLSDRWERV